MISIGLVFVGGSGLTLAGLGLLVNALMLATTLVRRPPPDERRKAPNSYLAFALIWPLSTALQIALAVVSVQLCQGRSSSAWGLATWSGAVLTYSLSISALTRLCPRPIGTSIAAAAASANVWLVLHSFTAFPLWGTLLALLLHRLA